MVPKRALEAQPAHGCESAAMETQGEHEEERHAQAGSVTTKTADVVVHKVQTGAHHGDTTAKLASAIEPERLAHAGGAAPRRRCSSAWATPRPPSTPRAAIPAPSCAGEHCV